LPPAQNRFGRIEKYQEGEKDGFSDAAGGEDRLFSPPFRSCCSIARPDHSMVRALQQERRFGFTAVREIKFATVGAPSGFISADKA
jgi:hypothetical protein